MTREDMTAALEAIAKSGLTVKGDLVLEKKVDYEVANVESGGIGIQINNGKDVPMTVSNKGIRQSVLDYVSRLMPVVAADFRERFTKIWAEILEQDAVSQVVYYRGRQHGTVFNRNLVAQITHMMVGSIINHDTKPGMMAELLEPAKGKDHPVRGALYVSPEDKQVKKAVKEVLEKHGVKIK